MEQTLIARAPGWSFDPGMYEFLVLVGGLVILAGAVALSLQKGRPFSAALIYLSVGVVAGIALRVLGLRWYDPIEDAVLFSRAAEMAVIVSLFGAGVKLDRPFTWRAWRPTVLLLAIAMPITIAGVAFLGSWLLALALPSAVLLGSVLAPTDPVLAEDVQVGGPMQHEPEDDARFAITSEAGLNDGLAFPFVMLALFGYTAGFDAIGSWWLEWLTADFVYAIAAGLVIGALAGRLVAAFTYNVIDRGWLANPFDAFVAIGAIFAVYGATEIVGGYGFLAVFAAGVTFRRFEQSHEINERLHDVTLVIEKLGELSVLLLLGSVLPIAGVLELGWPVFVVALGLVLVVRPVAVMVALIPSRLALRQRLFIAWFGIRGIGSIYYLGFAFATLTPVDARPLFSVTAVAILVSVLLHGLSSGPLSGRLSAADDATEPDAPAAAT